MLVSSQAQSGHQGYRGEKKPHLLPAEGRVLRPVEDSQPSGCPATGPPGTQPCSSHCLGLGGADRKPSPGSGVGFPLGRPSLALLGDRTSQLELGLKPERYEQMFTQDSLRGKLTEEEARQRAEETVPSVTVRALESTQA